ncbi:UNVERIFIED_CONTAM: hypothetical protein Sradi_3429000 [Sesamum radiatum]|uniref:Uncharacterized protein n=1 Tax=Sesamum radiatum TaxID=300843 RepID=A0AAW2R557_SESRA
MIYTYFVKAISLREKLFSHLQRTPIASQGTAQRRKLEDKVERLGTETAKLKEETMEAMGRYQ